MKLDRNVNEEGLGKYALILNRKVQELRSNEVSMLLNRLEELGVLDTGAQNEFFVIRLKDHHATPALCAYAKSCFEHNEIEYGGEIMLLADRAESHPDKKQPD